MAAVQATIIGSRTGTDDYRHQLDIHPSGAAVVAVHEIIPTDDMKLNPEFSFVYTTSGTSTTGSLIGSVFMNFDTGSFVNVISYDAGGAVTNVSPWSVV